MFGLITNEGTDADKARSKIDDDEGKPEGTGGVGAGGAKDEGTDEADSARAKDEDGSSEAAEEDGSSEAGSVGSRGR